MKQYRIQMPDGKVELVSSLDGHHNCIVLEENVTSPRVPGCERVDGKWKINKEEFHRIRLETMSKHEMIKMLLTLEERIAKLEAKELL